VRAQPPIESARQGSPIEAARQGSPIEAARQGSPIEPIRIDVRAVATCSDDESFFAQVQGRTANARRARTGEEARTFRVGVTHDGTRFVGHLTIIENGKTSRAREVSASSCEDVISALALVTALAIDPNALAAPAPPVSPSVAAPVAAPAASTPSPGSPPTLPAAPTVSVPVSVPSPPSQTDPAPAPAAREPAPQSPPPAVTASGTGPTPRDRAPARSSASAPKESRPSWMLGALFDVLAIGTPVPRAGIGIRRTWESGASASLAVSAASGYRPAQTGPGGARLLWATATLDACPVRWALPRSIELSPCIPVEAGVFVVSGDGVPSASTQPRPWFSVGALARLEIPLGGRVVAEARGGVSAPLIRDTFYFRPSNDVYQPPFIVGWGGIAAEIIFP
jgi:hypothetical protein